MFCILDTSSTALQKPTTTYCLVWVWGDAQGLLQTAAVLVHAQGEVSVAFVHSRHPFLDLSCVTVAFLAETVSQLDEQLHTLLCLLKNNRKLKTLEIYCTVKCLCACVCGQPWLWCGSPRAPSAAPVCDGCLSQWRCVWRGKTPQCHESTPEPEQTQTHQTDLPSDHMTAESSGHAGVPRWALQSCFFVYLFGTAFKHHILLTLVQPPFPHGPEVKNTILSL